MVVHHVRHALGQQPAFVPRLLGGFGLLDASQLLLAVAALHGQPGLQKAFLFRTLFSLVRRAALRIGPKPRHVRQIQRAAGVRVLEVCEGVAPGGRVRVPRLGQRV